MRVEPKVVTCPYCEGLGVLSERNPYFRSIPLAIVKELRGAQKAYLIRSSAISAGIQSDYDDNCSSLFDSAERLQRANAAVDAAIKEAEGA
jgi:hypothetical protein